MKHYQNMVRLSHPTKVKKATEIINEEKTSSTKKAEDVKPSSNKPKKKK